MLRFSLLKGNFGEVWKGKLIVKGGQPIDVAIKTCLEVLDEKEKKKFMLEMRICRRYDHPNLIKFIGVAAKKQPVMIVLELAACKSPFGCLNPFCQSSFRPGVFWVSEFCLNALLILRWGG